MAHAAERLVLALTLALVCVAHATTIFSVDWLPLGDYGGHLELMDIVARYDDPDTLYRDTYRLPDQPRPNTLALLFAELLGERVSTLTLGHALVAAYAVAFPLSLLLVAWAFRRSPWCAVLGAPLAFNAVLNVGFLNYLLGLPLIATCVALARVHADTSAPPRRWAGPALALALLVLFFAHAIAFLIGASMTLAVLLLYTRRVRDLLRLWPLAAAVPLMAIWAAQMFIAREATETGRTFATDQGLNLVFEPVGVRLAQLHTWGMAFFRDRADVPAFVVLASLWLAWLVLGLVARRRSPSVEARCAPRPNLLDTVRRFDLELLAACCFVAYLVLPSHMNEMEVIHHRTLVVAFIFAAAIPRLRPTDFGTRASWLIAPAMILAVAYPAVVATRFQRFVDDDVGRLPAMIEALPERSRLLYLMIDVPSRTTFMGPLWHLPTGLHTTLNGGMTDNSFAIRPYTPVQYAQGRTPVPISDLRGFAAQSPRLLDWDFVLVRSTEPPTDFLEHEFLHLVDHDDWWWLFEVRRVDNHGFATAMTGDPTGGARVVTCAPGQHLIGLDLGVAESRVASVVALCGRVVRGSERLQRMPPIGQDDLPLTTVRCPRGSPVVGLRGWVGHGVRALAPVCESEEAPVPLLGEEEGAPFELRCPAGQVVSRLRMRAGAWVDAAGIGCR